MPGEDKRVAMVSAEGPCLDRQTVEALSHRVSEARAAGAQRVVVEASVLREPEVGGLAALLAWAEKERGVTGARLALASPSRPLLLAICQTRLQREIDVYATPEAALRALGGER